MTTEIQTMHNTKHKMISKAIISLYQVTLTAMSHLCVHQISAPDEKTAIQRAIDWTVDMALGSIPNLAEEIKEYPAEVYEAAQMCRRDVHDITVECLATDPLTKADIERLRKRGIPMKQID